MHPAIPMANAWCRFDRLTGRTVKEDSPFVPLQPLHRRDTRHHRIAVMLADQHQALYRGFAQTPLDWGHFGEFNSSRAAGASASFWAPSEASVGPSTPHVLEIGLDLINQGLRFR